MFDHVGLICQSRFEKACGLSQLLMLEIAAEEQRQRQTT